MFKVKSKGYNERIVNKFTELYDNGEVDEDTAVLMIIHNPVQAVNYL